MKRCPQCTRVQSDDALTFCRADGTALVTDLSSLGTPSVTSEIETSILPHTTDTAISRATAPTPVLPAAQTAPTTHALAKPTQRKVLVAMVVLFVVVGIAIAGYFYIAGKRERAIESVAVLPFENKSNDADTEYLSDGLAESLIYRLSQLPNLKVSPTSSVFRYKGKELDAQKIAADLRVTAVMTGRMVQRGQNLTISVELIDAKSNKLLWGEQFERKMSDLLATQREIAAAITEKLQLKLSGEDAKGITKHYTENNEAYQAYLKGRYYWRQRGGKNISTGIGYFQEAIKLDPNFALAWSGLADSYVLLPEYTTT